MQNFKEFGLPLVLSSTLDNMNFKIPTPIQAQVLPHALSGKDILGSAQTGTGKTGAFGIPLVSYLISNPQGIALVMTPTRELAKQVLTQLQEMLGSERNQIKSALLIGGDSMQKQLQQLRQHPRIIVGTPGRINDHLKRRSLGLKNVKFLVLDEIDRMLDMGFSIQIDLIMKHVPDERQTMLFSATIPHNIVRMAEKYLKDPIRVAVAPEATHAEKIKHEIIKLQESDKHERLLAELEARNGSIIIFVKTKYGADKLATKLDKLGHSADAIHGDLRQNKRDKVIANFRSKKYRILVATDVAARGLDIPHIEHVINYDLPSCAEDYIHRIGRTARAGAVGSAVCMITPSDQNKWGAINRLMNPGMPAEKFERSCKKRSSRNSKRSFGKPRRFDKNDGFEKKDRGFRSKESSFENKDADFGNSERPFEKRERSFGNKERSFGNRERSFGKKEGRFGNKEKSFGRKERSFGDREKSFEKREGDFGNREERSFEKRERSFGNKERSFGTRERSFGKKEGRFGNRERSFENKEDRFGSRERSFGKKEGRFGKGERSFGKKRSFSGRPKRKSFA